MAQYSVTHSCKHVEIHQLYGPHKSRDSKISWLETRLCGECYQQELQAARKTQNEQAAAANQAKGLPTLNGSEKQIAWAESIRKPVIDTLAQVELCLSAKLTSEISEIARLELRDALDLLIDEIGGETSASKWIDRRFALDTYTSVERASVELLRAADERGLAPTLFREQEELVAAAEAAKHVAAAAKTARQEECVREFQPVSSARLHNQLGCWSLRVAVTSASGQVGKVEVVDGIVPAAKLGEIDRESYTGSQLLAKRICDFAVQEYTRWKSELKAEAETAAARKKKRAARKGAQS